MLNNLFCAKLTIILVWSFRVSVMLNKKMIDSFIRINHAGEFAAKRIYQGQFKYMKDPDAKDLIKRMAEEEQVHLDYFENEIKARKIRPTLLYPLVDKIAYGLGAITGALGKDASMLCTAAVEDAIVGHYEDQISYLDSSEEDLKSAIKKFSEEELEHKKIAEEESGKQIQSSTIAYRFINSGCKLAIKMVKYL